MRAVQAARLGAGHGAGRDSVRGRDRARPAVGELVGADVARVVVGDAGDAVRPGIAAVVVEVLVVHPGLVDRGVVEAAGGGDVEFRGEVDGVADIDLEFLHPGAERDRRQVVAPAEHGLVGGRGRQPVGGEAVFPVGDDHGLVADQAGQLGVLPIADAGLVEGDAEGEGVLVVHERRGVGPLGRDAHGVLPGRRGHQAGVDRAGPAAIAERQGVGPGDRIDRRAARRGVGALGARGVGRERAVVVEAAVVEVGVAVQAAGVGAPPIDLARQLVGVVQPMARLQVHQAHLVGDGIRPGVGGLGRGQHVHRQGLGAVQRRVGVGARQFHQRPVGRAMPADLPEQLLDLGSRVVAEAVLPVVVAGQEIIGVGARVRSAGLHGRRPAAERSAEDAERRARAVLAGAGVDHQGAAQRVEAEQGVGAGLHLDARGRVHRDQIPVDDRTERLVDPHPVEIDREGHRRAQQRGRLEAPVVHVVLIGVAGPVADADRTEVAVQEVGEVGRVLAGDLA